MEWDISRFKGNAMVGSDRELLTLAARAANITFVRWNDGDEVYRGGFILEPSCIWCIWNPLTCDGDAFRLAVTLRIDVGAGRTPDGVEVCMASHGDLFSGWFEEPYGEVDILLGVMSEDSLAAGHVRPGECLLLH